MAEASPGPMPPVYDTLFTCTPDGVPEPRFPEKLIAMLKNAQLQIAPQMSQLRPVVIHYPLSTIHYLISVAALRPKYQYLVRNSKIPFTSSAKRERGFLRPRISNCTR